MNSAEYKRNWYLKNKARLLEKAKLYRESNKDKIKDYQKSISAEKRKIYKNNGNTNHKAYMKSYRLVNKAKLTKQTNDYSKNRRKYDITYRLASILRKRVNHCLKGRVKSGSAVKDLGCTLVEFRIYLESKFKPGMNWNNYGIKGWHIDHIIPISSYNLSSRDQFQKVCHYTNLQPLWAYENLSKGNRR